MKFRESVVEAGEDGRVGVDAAVAEEGPPAAYLLGAAHVDVDYGGGFGVGGGLEEEFSLGACYEAVAPECDAVGGSGGVGFTAYAVDGYDGEAVGYGVAALHCDPCFALACLFVGGVGAFVAYGCGVDEYFGSGECHDAGCFGVPLVPAYEHAEASDRGVNRFEAEVAGGEVEFLVVGGIVGYVHLAVFAGYGAVGVEDYGGVVVEAGGASLEHGGDDDYAEFGGELAVGEDRVVVERKGEVAFIDIFRLAEVEGIVQLLIDDEPGAVGGEGADFVHDAASVAGDVGSVVLLYDTCAEYTGCFHIGSISLGNCIVTQWSEPCWRMSGRQSTVMIRRPGNAICIICEASRSLAAWP